MKNTLYGNAIVGQSGGPTAAINATLSGVIKGASKCPQIGKIFGMKNGIEGLLEEMLVDLTPYSKNKKWLYDLENTPSAYLGSCRKRLKKFEDDAETYEKLLEIFKNFNIRYVFYIGGNDSMDTALKLSDYAKMHDFEMRVIGIPKTIDNDLAITDHTPGFGSAAKYVATTVKEILRDVSVYTLKAVTIVEIMGRDAGWLTTAAALPTVSGGKAPDLIYLPEKPFSDEEFIASIKEIQEKQPAVLIAVSEGIRYENGEYVSAAKGKGLDSFGHKQLSGTGKYLENLVKEKIGCKSRSVELNISQRCASHILSETDILESVEVGKTAVLTAMQGKTGVMITIERKYVKTKYVSTFGTCDIKDVANNVKQVPDEFISEEGNYVTQACIDYLLPLIQGERKLNYENGLPKHVVL